ncbi:MAG: glycosyltransferase family 2 protein, partial [Chitinophagaceae bacterium]|nr:glycosyltransferase family 2 protein [Chitinophagaceae bacterium]
MNRLHHLRQTLPINLENNTDADTKFLVLDYNSDDGLQEYILNNFSRELQEGRLEYHHYAHAKYFSHSHSRNLAVKIADAGYVCNVDADNFTGRDFDKYLFEQFDAHPKAVISGLSNPHNIYGAFGRMATRKTHFFEVGGYDET